MSDNIQERARALHEQWQALLGQGLFEEAEHLLEQADTETRSLAEAQSIASALQSGPVLEPGYEVGGFELLEELGRGSFATVWKARCGTTGRVVALKVLWLRHVHSERGIQRFQTEAQAQSKVQHPAVRKIEAYSSEGSFQFSVNELIDPACTLDRWILTEPGSPDAGRCSAAYQRRVAELFAELAGGLAAVAEAGVVHRDVKPQNILVDSEGRPHLIDFGVARLPTPSSLTRGGELIGTRIYMSPEALLVEQRDLDGRADVYSAGVCLYEALVGTPPFDAGSDSELAAQQLWKTPVNPRERDRRIDRRLAAIVIACTRPNREDRYPSASDLERDLRAFLEGGRVRAKGVRPGDRLRQLRQRRPVAAATGAVALASVGLLLAVRLVAPEVEAETPFGPPPNTAFEPLSPGPLSTAPPSTEPLWAEPLPSEPQRGEFWVDRIGDLDLARADHVVPATPMDLAADWIEPAEDSRDSDRASGPPERHSPDGAWLATGLRWGRLRVTDAGSGAIAFEGALDGTTLTELHWCADSSRVLALLDRPGYRTVLQVVARPADPAAGWTALPHLPSASETFAWTADGRYLARVRNDGSVTLDDLDRPGSRVRLQGLGSSIAQLAFDPADDGRLLATDGAGNGCEWRLELAPQTVEFLPGSVGGNALALHEGPGRHEVLRADPEGRLTRIDLETGAPLALAAHLDGGAMSVDYADAGALAAAVSPSGGLVVLDADLTSPPLHEDPGSPRLRRKVVRGHPGRALFAIVCRTGDGTAPAGLQLAARDAQGPDWSVQDVDLAPEQLAFDPDTGDLILALDGSLERHSISALLRGERIAAPPFSPAPLQSTAPCTALAVLPGSRGVLAGHEDGTVSLHSDTETRTLPNPEGARSKIVDFTVLDGGRSFAWLDSGSRSGVHRSDDLGFLGLLPLPTDTTVKDLAHSARFGRMLVLEGSGRLSTLESEAAAARAAELDALRASRLVRELYAEFAETCSMAAVGRRLALRAEREGETESLALARRLCRVLEVQPGGVVATAAGRAALDPEAGTERWSLAADALARVLAEEPDNPFRAERWTTLGLLALRLGDDERAAAAFESGASALDDIAERLLGVSPSPRAIEPSPALLAGQAIVLARTGTLEEARSCLARAEQGANADSKDPKEEALLRWAREALR